MERGTTLDTTKVVSVEVFTESEEETLVVGITTSDSEDFSAGVVFTEPKEKASTVFFTLTAGAVFVDDFTLVDFSTLVTFLHKAGEPALAAE